MSSQVVHILNMTTAQVHSFQLTADENLHSLQKRIEAETKIEVANQELLQETGVSLDPRKPAAQCVLDGVVSCWSEPGLFPCRCRRFQMFLSVPLHREAGTATSSTCSTRASPPTLGPSAPGSSLIKSTPSVGFQFSVESWFPLFSHSALF